MQSASLPPKKKIVPLYRVLPRHIRDFRPPDDIPTDELWTSDAVEARLIEAVKVVQRTAGRVAPKRYGSSMPEYMHDWGDLLGQAEAGNIFEGGNQIRIGASQATMTRVEEAMMWPMQFLEEFSEQRTALMQVYLRSIALRRPLRPLLKRAHMDRTTAWRHKNKALTVIAIGLIMNRVPLVRAREADASEIEEFAND